MRTRAHLLLTLLSFATLPVAAQELLPAVLGNLPAISAQKVAPTEIEQFAGSDASILREYGITGAERRTYARAGESVRVTLYLFPDSTTAYGAFSFLRTAALDAGSNRPKATSGSRERGLLGNLILDAVGSGLGAQRAALKVLEQQLLVRADGAPYPMLVQYLPTKGLIPGSERFLLGPMALAQALPIEQSDWVGFRNGAEAVLARFRENGREVTLLLISYPTPQAAHIKQVELGRWFNVDNAEKEPTKRPVVYVRRTLSLLAIAAQTDSSEAARAVLQRVSYQPNFSWNEPAFRATEPPLMVMIYHMMVGIGVLLAFATVAGISFGGFRLVVKWMLPGKVFDRDEAVEIIQLGLSSKPIEAKDFY